MAQAARGALAALLAAAALAGCGGGAPEGGREHDLAAAFPVAEVRREAGRIDFGTPAAREHLRDGWHGNERRPGGETLVWSRGTASTLAFFLAAPRVLRAELRCAPAADAAGREQAVSVEVNGERAGELALSPGLRTYSIELPVSLLRAGENRLTFRYRHVVALRPGGRERRRGLAVAWHDLRLLPLPVLAAAPRAEPERRSLMVPWGSEVAYVLDLDGEARLEVERVETVGRWAGRLVVVAKEEEDQVGRELVAVAPGARGLWGWVGGTRQGARVELRGEGRRLVRVALRAVGDGATPADGGLRLVAPKLRVGAAARDPLPAVGLLVGVANFATPPGPPPPSSLPDLFSPASSTTAATAPRPNVLIYLIDALRTDRLGCYGNPRGLTPHLDAFAARALLFERAVAQAPWTRPAVASLFTGLGPLRHGVRTLNDRLPAAAETLAERLQAAGWRTAAFSTNAHVTRETGFDQGFDHFDFSPEEPESEALNRRFLAWLDGAASSGRAVGAAGAGAGAGAPFLAYLHALDPHAPYTPPADLRARFAPGVRPRAGTRFGVRRAYAARGPARARMVADMAQLYDAEVAANDRAFGALLDALARRGLLDSTLVVLLADHGEEFDEHGALGHGNNLHEETVRIPLLLRLPGQARGRRFRGVAQQIDVLPTVLAQAGLAAPAALPGADLVRIARGAAAGERPAISHLTYSDRAALSVVLGAWKLIQPLSPASGTAPRLYDLSADPRETTDLAARNPVRAAHLAAFLRAERLAARGGGFAAERATLDEESRRALEALGYL